MDAKQWRGVFPALTTKFKPDYTLDFEALAQHLEFQLAAGVDGVIILGSLGENPALDGCEKLRLCEFFVRTVRKRVPVIACIAESATHRAQAFAAAAREAGVDGFMLLPPMRYPSDRRETLAYLETVAAAADAPIMLYNNPVAYGTDLAPEDFRTLAANPAFAAIKESSGDTRRIPEIRRLTAERYAIFCGVDDLAYECFSLGAQGWVAGLVVAFPRETVRLYQLMRDGRWDQARALYEWFLPLLHLDVGPKFVQQIKLVEQIMGVGSARVRPPRLELSENEAEQVAAIVERALASRPSA